MELRRWEVDGYRNLSDIHFDVGTSAVLIGLNNSGKSNLLLSLRDYFRLLNNDIPNLPDWIEENQSRGNTDEEIRFKAVYRSTIEELKPIINELAQETGIRNGAEFFGESNWTDLDDSQSIDVVHRLHILEGSGYEYIEVDNRDVLQWDWSLSERENQDEYDLRWGDHPEAETNIVTDDYWKFGCLFSEEFGAFRTLGPIRDPEPSTVDRGTSNAVGVDPRATKLVETMQVLDRERVDGEPIIDCLEDDFIDIVENISGIRVGHADGDAVFERPGLAENTDGDSSEPHGETILLEHEYPADSGSSVSIPLKNASTGTKELLALLSRIYITEYQGGLLLIEEPEVHLHPRAEQLIIDRINRAIENSDATIILSTHSEKVIQTAGIDRIHLIRTTEEGHVTINRGPPDTDIPAHLHSELGDVLQADFVVVAESAVDVEILKTLLARTATASSNRSLLKVTFVSCGHRGHIFEEVDILADCLNHFEIPFCCVLNSLEEDPDEVSRATREILELDDSELFVWEAYSVESWLLSEGALETILPDADTSTIDFDEYQNPRDFLRTVFQTVEWEYSEQRAYRTISDGVRIANEIGLESLPAEFDRFVRYVRERIEE